MKNNESGISMLPPNILENLTKYTTHKQGTCFHCGYIGLMGYIADKKRINMWIGVAILIGLLIFFSWYWSLIIVGIIELIYFFTVNKKHIECPNCHSKTTE